jgi:hypothetical protein
MKTSPLLFVGTLCFLIPACGDPEPESAHPHPHPHPGENAAPADHGTATSLGTVTVAGISFGIVRLGELVPGADSAFEISPQGLSAAELASLNTYLWLESEDGSQLSAPAKGSVEGTKLHFHASLQAGEKAPFRVVLRVRKDGGDERASLPLDGHGHEHADGPHDGVLAEFRGGDAAGHLELKLHDDKGDLELWLAQDEQFTKPLDLPMDASIEVEFIDHAGKKVTMRARNATTNEDESGNPNVRAGLTNYFIFPGSSGEDAAWLRGREFQSIVVVRFTRSGVVLASEEFVLKPHTH